MKKLAVLFLALGLVACSSGKAPEVKSGHAEHELESGEKVVVDVKLEDGKITEITIDETYKDRDGNATTKKALKDDYNMLDASAKSGNIEGGAEWYTQIENLEKKLVGTDGKFDVNEEGKATDPDIFAGCTIRLDDIEKAVEKAVADANK